jgi:hypothetical protein
MMKRTILAAALLLSFAQAGQSAVPQSTAFTYQGNLSASGHPANGNFDLTFKLFDALTGGSQVGGTITMAQFPVANGAFTTDLDFPGAFTGNQLWLEVTVGGQVLSPRQAVNSVPVAQTVLSAPTVFTSSGNATLTTPPMAGLPASVAVLPLSGNASLGLAQLLGPLDMTALGAPQVLARGGTITSIAAQASTSQTLTGVMPFTVTAQLYMGVPNSNLMTPVPGAACSMFFPLTILPVGTMASCQSAGLSIPYVPQSTFVIVFSQTMAGVPIPTTGYYYVSASVVM